MTTYCAQRSIRLIQAIPSPDQTLLFSWNTRDLLDPEGEIIQRQVAVDGEVIDLLLAVDYINDIHRELVDVFFLRRPVALRST